MIKQEVLEAYDKKQKLDDFIFNQFTKYVDTHAHMMGDEEMDSYEIFNGNIFINWTAQYKYESNQKGLEKIDLDEFLGV